MTALNDEKRLSSYTRKKIGEFFRQYDTDSDPGFSLKTAHTYRVADTALRIARMEGLSSIDTELAEVIGLLHDIGRFEELRKTSEFNSVKFDHAKEGAMMLEGGMIRDFVNMDLYDDIIIQAVAYHSLYSLPEDLDDRTALHAKIIRDADKIDNMRIKVNEPAETMFGTRFKDRREFENSFVSEAVMESLRAHRCVRVSDRITPLDYYVTVFGFWFDLNFESSREIIRENGYMKAMLERFDFTDPRAQVQMKEIAALVSCAK